MSMLPRSMLIFFSFIGAFLFFTFLVCLVPECEYENLESGVEMNDNYEEDNGDDRKKNCERKLYDGSTEEGNNTGYY